VANVGTLVQPLTKAQYLSTSHGKAGKPLFAYRPAASMAGIDLEHLVSNSGWGGRLSDQLAA
jgi:hypothetical protein